jgi:hypothetical protein
MAALLKGGASEDQDVMTALQEMTLSVEIETVYVTLLAIYILAEAFEDKEDEWTLLARKAKTFLKNSGVDKPDKILRLFNLEI